MKPTVPITDSAFPYADSANTDIRKTFARARQQIAAAAANAPGGPRPTRGIGDDPTRAHCPVTLKPCGERMRSGAYRCSRDRECSARPAVVPMRKAKP